MPPVWTTWPRATRRSTPSPRAAVSSPSPTSSRSSTREPRGRTWPPPSFRPSSPRPLRAWPAGAPSAVTSCSWAGRCTSCPSCAPPSSGPWRTRSTPSPAPTTPSSTSPSVPPCSPRASRRRSRSCPPVWPPARPCPWAPPGCVRCSRTPPSWRPSVSVTPARTLSGPTGRLPRSPPRRVDLSRTARTTSSTPSTTRGLMQRRGRVGSSGTVTASWGSMPARRRSRPWSWTGAGGSCGSTMPETRATR